MLVLIIGRHFDIITHVSTSPSLRYFYKSPVTFQNKRVQCWQSAVTLLFCLLDKNCNAHCALYLNYCSRENWCGGWDAKLFECLAFQYKVHQKRGSLDATHTRSGVGTCIHSSLWDAKKCQLLMFVTFCRWGCQHSETLWVLLDRIRSGSKPPLQVQYGGDQHCWV